MAEQREFIRMKINTSVVITDQSSGKEYKGSCNDLSGTGMQLHTSQSFEPGTKVDVKIEAGRIPFHASGEVVRSYEEGEGFVVALKLSEID